MRFGAERVGTVVVVDVRSSVHTVIGVVGRGGSEGVRRDVIAAGERVRLANDWCLRSADKKGEASDHHGLND